MTVSRRFPFLVLAVAAASALAALLLARLEIISVQGSIAHLVILGCLIGLLALPLATLLRNAAMEPVRNLRAEIETLENLKGEIRLGGGDHPDSRLLAQAVSRAGNRLLSRIDELELDKERLRTILEGLSEGVIAVDERQSIVFINRSAGTMLAIPPESAVGQPFYRLTRHPRIQQCLERGMASDQPTREEIEWTAGGSRHFGVYAARLERDAAGGAILVLNDNTELRRLEQLRRDFVANVSHELKTPLAVIQASAEALLDGAVDDPEVRLPFLRQVSDNSQRLHSLILDLIRLARIESGQEIFDLMAISVRDAAIDCVGRHRRRAEARRMTLEIPDDHTEDAVVSVDPEAIEQILDNLVDNAIKYSAEGGTVRIDWRIDGESAAIRVADEGPGIPAADLPRVFERFYRVDKARSRELGGTGLGLSIVKHLAQVMKGRVQAESRTGEGTAVTVWLPLAKSI